MELIELGPPTLSVPSSPSYILFNSIPILPVFLRPVAASLILGSDIIPSHMHITIEWVEDGPIRMSYGKRWKWFELEDTDQEGP